jgi:hypothetical protein
MVTIPGARGASDTGGRVAALTSNLSDQIVQTAFLAEKMQHQQPHCAAQGHCDVPIVEIRSFRRRSAAWASAVGGRARQQRRHLSANAGTLSPQVSVGPTSSLLHKVLSCGGRAQDPQARTRAQVTSERNGPGSD